MTTEREEIELHPAVGELIVKMRADLATAIARADAAEFALQCEATRHEETRAAVRAFAPQCSQCEALATRRIDGYGGGEAARCDECSPSPESHPWSHDLPHAAAVRASGRAAR